MGTGFSPQRLSVSACHMALMRHHVPLMRHHAPLSIHGLVPALASRLVLDGRRHGIQGPEALFSGLSAYP